MLNIFPPHRFLASFWLGGALEFYPHRLEKDSDLVKVITVQIEDPSHCIGVISPIIFLVNLFWILLLGWNDPFLIQSSVKNAGLQSFENCEDTLFKKYFGS